MRVLVAYATADGSTAEVAERVGARLRDGGHDVTVGSAGSAPSVGRFDAVVIGSAVHSRQWLEEATMFVDHNWAALRARPVWTFSVGMPDALPRAVRKLARTEETGIVAELGVEPAGHRLFSGVVGPSQFPVGSRIFFRLLGGHYGDYRDWGAIDSWATEIAGRLAAQADRARAAAPLTGG